MSRLPTLSTPGRSSTSTPTTGIPTPTTRRPRSSLGPGHVPTPSTSDEIMDKALQEALKVRPPSSLRHNGPEDPSSPSLLGVSSSGLGLGAPRTPGVRPKTPLGLGAPMTPSASRSVSRTGRPSLSASTTNPFTPRRTSMASSTTSTTPFARRPESRASNAHDTSKWVPVVGEKVRINSMGYEGILRFLGPTQFKEGVWAGVELEGGFAGKGKNDGTVEGTSYFTCPPLCGIFVIATKLSPPTAGPSRPSSVASSHRSLASSSASYSLHGRATPSFDRTLRESTNATPGRTTRAVSSSVRRPPPLDDDEPLPTRTALGTSTSANAGVASKITAGSRASRYVGMTAKQLDSARNGTLNASVKGTASTPKPSRVSMGGGITPARSARQSIGGASLVTPRPARGPRASNIHDMPPPPSPSNINRVVVARQTEALEEEIRELKRRNAELEEEIRNVAEAASDLPQLEDLQNQASLAREEADSLRSQLADAQDAARLAEELQVAHTSSQEELASKEKALNDLKKEMKLVSERNEAELSAGMESKKEEVRRMTERAEAAEMEAAEMKALVDELTNAGQQMISLNETKQYELEERVRELEDRNRLLDEKLQKAREEQEKALLPPSPTTRQREAATAAEIDNETLNAQVKHQSNKISHLEEELDDLRSQAENEAEAWKVKLNRSKDSEKATQEQMVGLRDDIKKLNEQLQGAKGRVNELEGALRENQSALEGARAEIEGLRGEASEAASMRSALQTATANEKALSAAQDELRDLRARLSAALGAESQLKETRDRLAESESRAEGAEKRVVEVVERLNDVEGVKGDLEAKISSLENEVTTLKASAASSLENNLPQDRRSRLSTGSTDDADKKIRGFQHIIQELSAENSELKEQVESLKEEVVLMKEEIKLLEDAAADGQAPSGSGSGSGVDQKELSDAKAMIKELNREVAELESLIEAKIYREDELENRASSLEREIERLRSSSSTSSAARGNKLSDGPSDTTSHTRSSSIATAGTTASADDRCELCEGPHDLDACPVFAGNMLSMDGVGGKKSGGGKWCADCESTEHDTADCPMAEDVF
ncbi:hypothetical protein I302_107145 [Kwoniella bestiolae CBS 10118]|uniref:CAP-Gly domain-containing protein n=1 Tax=Kwoniella bestiolae CBS 10118 TaxID=1296100 RepID=A0A1B9FZF0_9TREE|nr:hypothetical protein I302_05589 [Kwoniella bestiolae CBS 10118]OCF24131.1 hypothetical protein I302_05589 [Kwoniella bestiolae CBS 10118]